MKKSMNFLVKYVHGTFAKKRRVSKRICSPNYGTVIRRHHLCENRRVAFTYQIIRVEGTANRMKLPIPRKVSHVGAARVFSQEGENLI
jgi:hypothetical protein